jgi:hypothetical protein
MCLTDACFLTVRLCVWGDSDPNVLEKYLEKEKHKGPLAPRSKL